MEEEIGENAVKNNEERFTFQEEIENLHRLHYISQHYDHIIGTRNFWRLFEPTKFVYAYFSFNTLYNIDWEISIEKRQLIPHKQELINGEERELSEPKKFKKMIDFIFQYANEKEKIDFLNSLKGRNNSKRKNHNAEGEKYLIALENMRIGNKIDISKKSNFIREYKKLLDENDINVNKLKNDILFLIYLVRNNIFHGTKNNIDMTDNKQINRLKIYSNIILGINTLLFNVIKQETGITLNNKYHLS